jgi:hypothetical protein
MAYRYLIFTQYSIQAISFEPLAKQQRTATYLEGQFLARGDEFPSTLVPSLVTTAPPFSLHHFHPFPPFPPLGHITLFTETTSTITVFFVRNTFSGKNNYKNFIMTFLCWYTITLELGVSRIFRYFNYIIHFSL